MAIIYSYPPNSNILPTDILVCTSTVLVGGKPKNQTKSISIQNLTSYINTSSTNNLNQVLTNGNSSLLNAKIGELYLYDTTELEYGRIKLYDSGFNFYDGFGNATNIISKEGIVFFPNANNASLLTTTITANRTYQLPNASGTIALTSNLSAYVPYTGATQAVDLGTYNLTVNGISVGKGSGTGLYNTAVGFQALSSNTTANGNTAVGYQALKTNTTGIYNSALGVESLYNNTTGEYNCAFGYRSMLANTGGRYNSAYGIQSLQNNTIGQYNTAIGLASLIFNISGLSNTAAGYQCLVNTTTGGENAGYGASALSNNTTGIRNVGLGVYCQLLNVTDSNSIVIGYAAIGAGSNTVTIGNTLITTTRLRGAVQGGSFVKDGGTSSQYLMADGSVTTAPYKYNFGGSLVLTGTLTATNLLTITIPANSLTDYLDIRSIMIQQSGPILGGMTVRVWHNSVNNFNTATRIANYAFGGGGADLFAQMTRRFSLQSGLLFGFPALGSNIAGEGSTANAALSTPFDPAVINYLFVSIQLNNATDTATLRNVNITT